MKKTFFAPLLLLPIAALLYLSGPVIDRNMTVEEFSINQDPETYLQEKESVIKDMRPDNEKKIIWASGEGVKTEYSVIYLHGFTASRNETAPLTDRIAKTIGANLFYTRLKGHGRYQLNSQDNIKTGDWLHDAEEAFKIGKMIGEKVIVVSCSTGAALATWLAERHRNDIEAMIMISPNFEPADRRIFFLSRRWGPVIAGIIEGEILGENETVISPAHANTWSYIYKTEMLFPVVALLEYTERVDYSDIDIPLAVFYSSKDKIVNQEKTKEVFNKWGSGHKEIFEVSNPGDKNGHIIAGDIFSPGTTDFILNKSLMFLRN